MNPLEIREASSAKDYSLARTLIEEYAATLAVDLCFQNFSSEISNLAGIYRAPDGSLLLACSDTKAVGCVALRRHDGTACEMKRLYLKPAYRGTGLGRRLVEQALRQARQLGYQRVLLDTLPGMAEAQSLYESLGFHEVEGYYRNPVGGVRYLALELTSLDSPPA